MYLAVYCAAEEVVYSVSMHAVNYDVLLSCTVHTIVLSNTSISIIMIIIFVEVFTCGTMIMTIYTHIIVLKDTLHWFR